ncbi:MAG TPA: M20/M25/M40 family metallo-hydrolase [Burkholderiaceae bacterium]|nr:M20/M25/M40 family metallo-hydrolase [Burkholderiaceae bacterium]
MLLDSLFQEELLALLAIDTVTPMETGRPSSIDDANRAYAALAHRIGMRTLFDGPGSIEGAAQGQVPLSVQRRLADEPLFLQWQPHMVLAIGDAPPERTIVFNFHMDTVSPHLPVRFEDGVIHGRGAVDNKGPGVAVLAALHRLARQRPAQFERMQVLIHCVAGEEGGAMGVYGTRHLVAQGHLGRLNVFVEPTAFGYFDASTCSMTFEVEFCGEGSTDDFPDRGDNATVALAFVAQHMAQALAGPAERLRTRMTVAGLTTGDQHNRVYGTGRLLMNFTYPDLEAGRACQVEVERAFRSAVDEFSRRFGDTPLFRRTAQRLDVTCRGRWLKAGLPVLANRDAEMEALLADIGVPRSDRVEDTFTCDAIWGQSPGAYSIVLGPGTLAANGAHTSREHVRLDDLERFAAIVHDLLLAFAHRCSEGDPR